MEILGVEERSEREEEAALNSQLILFVSRKNPGFTHYKSFWIKTNITALLGRLIASTSLGHTPFRLSPLSMCLKSIKNIAFKKYIPPLVQLLYGYNIYLSLNKAILNYIYFF